MIRIAIWGATGGAGREVLRECIADERVGEIVVFTRRALGQTDPSVREVIVEDFLHPDPEQLRGLDAAIWCLGVSATVVKEEAPYTEITHGYTMAAAKALREQSPDAIFHFVSGSGAKLNSRWMWARVKAATERDLGTLGFPRLLVWRPAFIYIVGGRGESPYADALLRVLMPVMRLIPGLVNSNVDIARAMLRTTFEQDHQGLITARDINRLAR